MRRKGDTVRYTAEEIDAMLAQGDSRTDWSAVKGMTEAELEASIAADPDDLRDAVDWAQAIEGCRPGSATSTFASTRTCSTGSGKPAAVIKRGSTAYCAPSWRADGAHNGSSAQVNGSSASSA